MTTKSSLFLSLYNSHSSEKWNLQKSNPWNQKGFVFLPTSFVEQSGRLCSAVPIYKKLLYTYSHVIPYFQQPTIISCVQISNLFLFCQLLLLTLAIILIYTKCIFLYFFLIFSYYIHISLEAPPIFSPDSHDRNHHQNGNQQD